MKSTFYPAPEPAPASLLVCLPLQSYMSFSRAFLLCVERGDVATAKGIIEAMAKYLIIL